jgi:two-component system, response regulator RegA
MNTHNQKLKKILIIDDDAVFTGRLHKAFRKRGFEAFTASTLLEADSLFQQHLPDWCLVDLKINQEFGLDFFEIIHKTYGNKCSMTNDLNTKIIVLTGYASITTAVEAMKRGAADYLQKPVDIDEIIHAFEKNKCNDKSIGRTSEDSLRIPSLSQLEWEHIQRVIRECGGNISKASKALGIHRRSLQRKLLKLP